MPEGKEKAVNETELIKENMSNDNGLRTGDEYIEEGDENGDSK